MMARMNHPGISDTTRTFNTSDTHAVAITLYGISNCDTVKKARAWLTAQGMDALGWEAVVNRRGTTWRQLDAAAQAAVCDAASAAVLLAQHPSAIKRPVVEWRKGGVLLHTSAGFDQGQWAQRVTELQD